MNFRSAAKGSIRFLLSLFNSEFLFEYWQIKKNEKKTLAPISNFYKGFIKPGMKVIDVGCNVGTYAKVFRNLGAEVIGVEPQKYCQQILKKRFKNDSGFHLIPMAAGASESMGQIHKSESHTIASMNKNWIDTVKKSNRFAGEDWNKQEKISITTLDKIISRFGQAHYLKIDVEGFEKDVLQGLHTPVNYISFEITLPEMQSGAIDCLKEINRLGNYLYAIPYGNFSDIKEWRTKEDMLLEIQHLCSSGNKVSSDIFCKTTANK